MPTRNTLDRATAMLPKLIYQRMDELGLDFAVLYPTAGIGVPLSPTRRRARRPAARSTGTAASSFANSAIA